MTESASLVGFGVAFARHRFIRRAVDPDAAPPRDTTPTDAEPTLHLTFVLGGDEQEPYDAWGLSISEAESLSSWLGRAASVLLTAGPAAGAPTRRRYPARAGYLAERATGAAHGDGRDVAVDVAAAFGPAGRRVRLAFFGDAGNVDAYLLPAERAREVADALARGAARLRDEPSGVEVGLVVGAFEARSTAGEAVGVEVEVQGWVPSSGYPRIRLAVVGGVWWFPDEEVGPLAGYLRAASEAASGGRVGHVGEFFKPEYHPEPWLVVSVEPAPVAGDAEPRVKLRMYDGINADAGDDGTTWLAASQAGDLAAFLGRALEVEAANPPLVRDPSVQDVVVADVRWG